MSTARRTRLWPLGIVVAAGALSATAASAEETVCTPEYYFNHSEVPPLIIPIDEARAAGSRVTRLDLETGDYRQHFGSDPEATLESGTMQILNPGSLRERIDFVALDAGEGLVLRISLVDEGMPFVRIDGDGLVTSGHCSYEVDQ